MWPAYVILGLLLVVYALIWFADASSRQVQVMQTLGATILGIILLTLWSLLFSKLSGRTRLKVAGVCAAVVLVATGLFRIQGVTGDFVPILTWRWASQEYGTIVSAGEAGDLLIADYPGFLGPNRNAVIEGVTLKDWTVAPPKELWRIKIGQGWSAFSVSGQTAVTQEQRGEDECVVAYDLLTGQQLWVHKDATRYDSPIGGIGPRATPTISNGKVYTVGSTGMMNCLRLSDGAVLWSKNIVDENEATIPDWGLACSPLVLGGNVIVSPGGKDQRSLVAYDAQDGAFVWGAGTRRAGYSSPSIHTVAGRDQILIFNKGSVAGHDPSMGTVLWKVPWPGGTECVAQPLPITENRVFVSSGYGIGCRLFEITPSDDGFDAEVLYETPRLKAKFANFVHYEGYIYGLDDGILVCLDPKTGERMWKRGRYGHGQLLRVGDKLILQTEDGEVVLIRPVPDKLIELGQVASFNSKTWNNPVLAGSLLIVRNDKEAVCYELALDVPNS